MNVYNPANHAANLTSKIIDTDYVLKCNVNIENSQNSISILVCILDCGCIQLHI